MKKILASLLVIASVATVGYLGTQAYFSDTEVSEDNVLAAGTIDIAVDDTNPWELRYTDSLTDMKPGAHAKEISFVITNVGENPVNIWKKVKITDRSTGIVSEPECTDQGGTWTGTCAWTTADVNDIDSQIVYSMDIDGSDLIMEDWDVRMSDVDDLWIPLMSLDPTESQTITQYYLLDEDAGNEYQGDEITFDMVLYAEQYMGPGPTSTTNGLVMENKDGSDHWTPVIDGTWGILTWDGSGNYRMRAWGLPGTQYQLQAWDSATDSDLGMFGPVVNPVTGEADFTGTYAGLNTHTAAKYWFRETASWDNAETLWEANLVN